MKQVIKEADQSLKRGQDYLNDAATKFRDGGDSGTATRIEKMAQEAGGIREEVKKKSDPKKG